MGAPDHATDWVKISELIRRPLAAGLKICRFETLRIFLIIMVAVPATKI